MEEFPSNSKEKKTEKPAKKIEKIIDGEVSVKKKRFTTRFKDVFFGGDAQTAGRYIVGEVLLPAFRDMIVDAMTKGTQRMIYGDQLPRSRHMSGSGPRISYNAPVTRGYRPGVMLPDQPPRGGFRGRARQEPNDIILASQGDANKILEMMIDIVDQYEVVSLSDVYDMMGQPATFVDNKWGWTDLRYATIRQIRDGYLLDLPPMEPID